MTFSLPLQILRLISKCNPITTKSLLHETSFLRKYLSNSESCNGTQTGLFTKLLSIPEYLVQKRLTSRHEANSEKVRNINKCHDKIVKSKRKLAFRVTTKEDCEACLDPIIHATKDVKVKRLKPAYDVSKMKYNHICIPDFCADSQRMDDIRGYKIEKKILPKLKANDCTPCSAFYPTKAPKIQPIEWIYDQSKLKQQRDCYIPECNVDPPRMDDICGYKVTPKKLPVIKPSDTCQPCGTLIPTKSPKLLRLRQRYDASKMKQERPCYEPICNEDPPRMDDIVGLKVTPKTLPDLVARECEPCIAIVPKTCPKLRPLIPKYDASKMQWNHPSCKHFCEDSIRMDDIKLPKITRKLLPKFSIGKCEPCSAFNPKFAPKLGRPSKIFDDSKLKWNHYCPLTLCEEAPRRMDDIMGLKIEQKRLPVYKMTTLCVPCSSSAPTKAPKLKPVKWIYDQSTLKQQRDCYIPECNVDPPRMDDIRGYKVTSKELPVLKPSDTCQPCGSLIPTKSPKLTRLLQRYDASKMKQARPCYEPKCNEDPPRMDDIVGLKVTPKKLPTFCFANKCEPCIDILPKTCPEIKPLIPKYDASKLKWDHPICKDFCEDSVRMDDIKLCKTTKKLPKFSIGKCKPCSAFNPKHAPKLKRPKQLYDPYLLDRTCAPPEDICDLDPPRMDDVKCWKPQAKKLPTFTSKPRTRFYSTYANTCRKASYCIYSSKNHSKLSPNILGQYRQYSCNKKCKIPKPKNCLPRCQKFRLKECKPVARKVCEDYWEKPCTKTEAPYCAYSEYPSTGLYEDPHSECENTYQVRLQPQKQVSRAFYKVKPVTPPFRLIEPSLDRKCIADLKEDPCKLDETDRWQNPCTCFSVSPCKKRYRRHCNDNHPLHKPCKKLEAPYKAFSERCPQFPEVEFTECGANEKCFKTGMVLNDIPCYKDYMVHYTASGKEEKRKLDCTEKPRKGTVKCSHPTPHPLDPPEKATVCGLKRKKQQKQGQCPPKPKCGGCKPEPKSKCSSTSTDKDAILDPSKKTALVCKSTKETTNETKFIECRSKDNQKMICVCKPVDNPQAPRKSSSKCSTTSPMKCPSKCSTKSAISCKPKKVSVKINPAKAKCIPKCTKSICSGSKVSDNELVQVSKPQLPQIPPSPLGFYSNPDDIPAANTMWEKICAYFRARPGCPNAAQFKQMQLEAEARRAAARAGLQIADPQIKYIIIHLPEPEDNLIKKKTSKSVCARQQTPKRLKCCPSNDQKLSLYDIVKEQCRVKADKKKKAKCKELIIPKASCCAIGKTSKQKKPNCENRKKRKKCLSKIKNKKKKLLRGKKDCSKKQ